MNTTTFKMKNRWHMRTAWLLSLGLLITSQAACDSTPGGGEDDTGGDTDPNTPHPDFPKFGEICSSDDDCEGGACSLWSDQSDERFCAAPCSDSTDCEELGDASCFTVPNDEGEIARVCAPVDLCIDPDNDGYGSGPGCLGFDCDQANPNIHPGAPELCNGIDNNCNGLVDDNPVDEGTACDTGYVGICATGRNVCRGGSLQCDATVLPGERQEICNGQDDDCDGLVDEGPDTDNNGNFVIGIGQPCGEEGSQCYLGPKSCEQVDVDGKPTWALTCELDNPFEDVPDLCDGIDNNCNGLIDEDYDDANYKKACRIGVGTCEGIGFYDCDPDDVEAPSICNAQPRPQNSVPEICDYNDNDCDGVIDNGFVNSDGVYDQIENCGQCDFNCNNLWQDPVARASVTPICVATSTTARCDFECGSDRRNLDGIRETGCEFTIDRQAIYVSHSSTGGENKATCGDYDSPCATIVYGLQRAKSASKLRVRVTEGLFPEPLKLEAGISILGGHSPRTWEEAPARFVTTIRGSQTKDKYQYAVLAENVTTATRIAGVSIEGPNAELGNNSVALLIIDSNQHLHIERVSIQGGDGSRGEKGGDGQNGRNGANGNKGKDIVEGATSCSNPPLLGGSGGSLAANFEGQTVTINGGSGTNSNCATYNTATEVGANQGRANSGTGPQTPQALGGRSRSNYFISDKGGCSYTSATAGSPEPGQNGKRGQNAGQAGSGASNGGGTIATGTLPSWLGNPGARGRDGQAGNGGGGGGSMGGIRRSTPTRFQYGPTGGGGGSGAEGGASGKGGSAGSASFGILIIQTAANVAVANLPKITHSQSFRGRGGQGGSGGQGGGGGQGGNGGSGGSPKNVGACVQVGGQGGRGGNGGHASGGGGGAGGASYDIAVIARSNSNGSAITTRYQQPTNVFHDGTSSATGGLGGTGGSSPSLTGTPGTTGASGTIRVWSY